MPGQDQRASRSTLNDFAPPFPSLLRRPRRVRCFDRRLRAAPPHTPPPIWPPGLQLKIAAVADLHACDPWMSLERIEAIVDRTNALDADVIVMLGDYVAGHRHVTGFIPA